MAILATWQGCGATLPSKVVVHHAEITLPWLLWLLCMVSSTANNGGNLWPTHTNSIPLAANKRMSPEWPQVVDLQRVIISLTEMDYSNTLC